MKLTPEIKQKLSLALQDHPEIQFAMLYGSAAQGEPFRDLDIGIYVDRIAVPSTSDLDYAFALADELEQMISYPVDVRVINDAPLPFRYQISRGLALLVHDRSAFFQFLEQTWRLYLDFEPIAMQYLREQR